MAFKKSSENDPVLRKLQKKEKREVKPAYLYGGAGVVVVALAVTAFFVLPFGGGEEEVAPTETRKTQPIGEDENDGILEDGDDIQFWQEEGKEYPVAIPDWSKDAHREQVGGDGNLSEETVAKIDNTFLGSNLYSSASMLPLEAAGFTSDDSKIFLEDGSINPQYSFWTAELFTREAGSAVERLLNPTYGGWVNYQYGGEYDPADLDPKLFSDLFTDRWFKENSGKSPSEYIPVFADWGRDNYGESKIVPAPGPRWYGVPQSENVEFSFDSDALQYTAVYQADITFIAYDKSGGRLEKQGKLSLTFVANQNGERGAGGKVLIDKASLTVGD